MTLKHFFIILTILPVLLAIYWTLRAFFRKLFLVIASNVALLLILGWETYLFCVLEIVSVFFICKYLLRRKRVLPSLMVILLVIKVFVLNGGGSPSFFNHTIMSPMGVLVFTMKEIHFIVETHKARIGRVSPISFFLYMTFSPTFLMGPVERVSDFVDILQNSAFSWEIVIKGCKRVLLGLVELFVIANLFQKMFAQYDLEYSILLWGSVRFFSVLWIFFMIDGYFNIINGISLLFGIPLLESVGKPFLALKRDVFSFLREINVSVYLWIRDYLYFPLVSFPFFRKHPSLIFLICLIASQTSHGGSLYSWGSIAVSLFSLKLSRRMHNYSIRRDRSLIFSACKYLVNLLLVNVMIVFIFRIF